MSDQSAVAERSLPDRASHVRPGMALVHLRVRGRRRVALVLAVVLSLLLAVPAMAYVEEGGTKNCGEWIAYTHARFTIDGWTLGPGDSVLLFWNFAAGWHTVEDNGQYSGWWLGRGVTDLDLANTWAGCRNFG